MLSRATDRPIEALVMTPDDLALGVASGQVVMPGNIEANLECREHARNGRGRTFDGRMAYSAGVTTDTVASCSADRRSNWKHWARQRSLRHRSLMRMGDDASSFPHHRAYSDGFWGRPGSVGIPARWALARTRPS